MLKCEPADNVYNSLQVLSIFVIVSITFTMQPHFLRLLMELSSNGPALSRWGSDSSRGGSSRSRGAEPPRASLTLTTARVSLRFSVWSSFDTCTASVPLPHHYSLRVMNDGCLQLAIFTELIARPEITRTGDIRLRRLQAVGESRCRPPTLMPSSSHVTATHFVYFFIYNVCAERVFI